MRCIPFGQCNLASTAAVREIEAELCLHALRASACTKAAPAIPIALLAR
ncbi:MULTISPECIES: hypothetical protein [Xanthomonas]|uniref:Uncharacterized protein n=1 Tax=Xanthomonas manihotis TaxID=43353 RepID=A0A8I1XGT0_XANMN|nr:hypothetical protein [Xanthomonas phaseoli]MBO9758611.1 hypothetical protein [Xanthomonas phaseoli pv. manihotis]MBO9780561.1 hypothetical protein [Xanthomonas phaseoli pv. dieffenbachiae]MBO9803249.1 hypothetical protein [Xanthomonas phaseoli pv. dieffenbachiae]MBO9821829.1 hypothetical protein [Xanthomonas phaseoli pv. dieffenbachiae]MBO9836415.1 hypothetical protein [Xanthomonas phaseoli pv. dieffenbachiae]